MTVSVDQAVYAAWLAQTGGRAEYRTLAQLEAAYLGHFDSLTSYVQLFVDEMGYNECLDSALPPAIRPYVEIRYDKLAKDVRRFRNLVVVPAQPTGVWLFDAPL